MHPSAMRRAQSALQAAGKGSGNAAGAAAASSGVPDPSKQFVRNDVPPDEFLKLIRKPNEFFNQSNPKMRTGDIKSRNSEFRFR
jgi:hypothetical protein